MARKSATKTVSNEVKEVIMTNETTERQFNAFNYVKSSILDEYVKNKLQGKDLKELTFKIKNYPNNSYVLSFLNKAGALKVANIKIDENVDLATGKNTKIYNITITDFDISAKAKSKAGKDFNVFDDTLIGRAFKKAIV